MNPTEYITWKGALLAYVVRTELDPTETTFLTQPELNLQMGFVVHPAGGEVARHKHGPIERSIIGTSEVLIMKKGRCEIDIYNNEKELVTTCELRKGDVVLILAGGHGLRVLEDTVLLEIRQGPYLGETDRERF